MAESLGFSRQLASAPTASILLVDDNPANLLSLRALLDDLGHNLVEASSGEEALAQMQSTEFAVILLDVLMPGISGFETAKLIRENDRLRRTPIIFLTAGDIDGSKIEEAYALGAVDLLVKPLMPVVLRAKVQGFIELFLDKQLARHEGRQFRLLVQGTTEYAIFMLDPEGHVLTWNSGAERLNGYQAEEIIGQHFSRFYPQEAIDRDWPGHELRFAIKEGRFEDEGWRVRKDGTQFWANVVITALRDETGHHRGFSKITRDMTERKHAEENAHRLVEETTARRMAEEKARLVQEQREALDKSVRLYRAIGESIDYGVWVCDPQGQNIYASESFLRLVGMTQEQCSAFGWSDVLHPEDSERILSAWKECVQKGNQWDMEQRFRGVDGQWHSILARGVPVKDEQGVITAWAGINLDISRLKQVEEELRDADRRKDEFLATLAHELRNPLAPIRNSLQILKMARVDATTVQQTRDMMERQVHHLVRLVDDLFDVSRVMRGKIELRKEHVELATVIARALETAHPFIEAQGHTLDTAIPTESLLLDADPVRLAQVVGNLLVNSAKYTEMNGRIWLSAQREGNQAVLKIRDTGVGIARDMLPHVFELFVQADHASTKVQGGLGIGLTLVKNLVEMHGGSVQAHSEGLGKGCEFVVRLPLLIKHTQQAGDSEGVQHNQDTQASGHRLMVVDDNHDAAITLSMLLRLQGHEVRVAHDGPTAIEIARSFRPDLIFLDIGMPGMDGYEVARRIRKTPGLAGTILAALTGWGQQEDRRRTAEAGFDHHLVKPPEPKVVESLLAEVELSKERAT